MLQDNEEKLGNNEVSFVPDETSNTTESGDALFVPDKKQPNLLSADINEIEKSQNAGGFMKFLTDVITADVQLQNKMDITKGELISGGVEGVAEATLTQPADIAASTLQVVGDLTDSKGISEFGKEMSNTVKSFNEFIEKDWITKDESIDPKIKQIARVMGAGGGQVLQMQGMAKSLGGAFTYALYTVPDASDVYLGYRKEGYGKTEAGTAGIATGAGFYAIDRFFDGAKLMKGMKNTSLGLLDVLLEPTAEMSQEAYKNMVFKIGPDKTRDLMSGVIESGIGGLAGGMVGSASVSINGVEYNPNTNYETARQAALDAGATEEDVNNLMAEMYTNIDSNPEKVSKYLTDLANKNAEQITSMIREMPKSVAYQSVNDFYKTVDEFITANEGTPEAERAKQTKTELDNVYKDTYSALENLMPKQEADANARLVQGHALFASQEFGVSPKTYMESMFARVEQGGKDFLGETAQMQEQLDVAQRINEIDAEEQANGVPEYTAPTININGVERQTTNSSGEPIAKSEKSLRYFYDWFGDSKVVDEQGRPLVVYHGTPNKIYDILKPGTHFTADKEYADIYQKQGASSAGYKKEAKNPGTYAVYLRMENPFDTRQEKSRNDFYKYYYQQMGMGTDLTEKGLPDWNDGRDLLDFITEYHPELGYDGIILDEGGTGGYGQEVKDRGISYVVKDSNQIKSTSNRGTFSGSENIYYQFGGENANLTPEQRSARTKAEEMEKQGKNPEEIWKETFWMKDKDGKWKFEIDDSKAKLKESEGLAEYTKSVPLYKELSEKMNRKYELEDLGQEGTKQYKDIQKRLDELSTQNIMFMYETKLSDLLEHKELYKMYPALKNMTVSFEELDGYDGMYSYADNQIKLNQNLALNKEEMMKTLMHEIQHYIQRVEDFARGGNKEEFSEEVMYQIKEQERILFEGKKKARYIDGLTKYVTKEQAEEIIQKTKELDDACIKELDSGDKDSEENRIKIEKEWEEMLKEYGITEEQARDAMFKGGIEERKRYNAISSLTDPYEFYDRLLGEIEARNTEKRLGYTEEERREKPPFVDRDYIGEEIILNSQGEIVVHPTMASMKEQSDRDLVVYHSISEGNLRKAIDFGGFAVPSLAITKATTPFDFAKSGITLVGNRGMIDPTNPRNEVYDRDVWSKTFPFETYGKVKKKTRDNFRDSVKNYFVKVGKENELGSLLYYVDRDITPERAVSDFISSDGAKLMYLEKEKGEKVEIPTFDSFERGLENIGKNYGFDIDKNLAEKIAEFDSYPSKETTEKEILPLIFEAIDKSTYNGKEAKYADRLKKVSKELFYEDGKVDEYNIEGLIRKCKEAIRDKGKKEVDRYAVREVLDERIKNKDEYESWAKKYIEDNLVGEPMVEVGKRKLPFTLENVVKSMTTGLTKNAQESFVYGSGKVIAAGAERLKSIKEIKQSENRLVTVEQEKETREKIEEDMQKFTSEFMSSSDFTNSMYQKEAAYRALGTLAESKNPTPEKLQSILDYEFGRKEKYSEELLDAGVNIAKSVRNLGRYYFEAKPQRAVMLNEFSGAIVPTDTKYDDISKKLQEQGLKVVRSDNQLEAVKEFEDVFFQDETNPRGAYYRGMIHLFQNANPSTFVHESMHFYKEELMKMKDKSAKAKSILETLESFASNEFAKNYMVLAKGGRFYVADKNGRTVYDKQGKLFETGDEAREYAKDELISKGFEQYVREGKSPSKFLTRAFHSFMNWLKHIYKSAKDLGVELNDSVRQAYGDLLGGQDLDYWMGQPEEAIISEVQSVEQDRKKYLDDVINQAVKEKGTKVSEGKGRGFRDIWTRSMIPLSTRAKRVSPLLQTRLRRFEFSLANNLNKKYDLSRPFLDIWKNMSEEDAIAFDLALKNDYVEKQQEIVAKYNATEQWAKIKGVLADIYTDAIGVGLELGYREDYFPRKVKDVGGFLSYMMGLEDWTRYQEALREADPENVFTPEEQAEFINKYMRGFVRVDLMPVKYGSEKQRKVPVVNNEINRFYAPSIDSYVSYIEGMNARIESAKFLGKDAENYDESIGGYLTYLQEQNLIKPSQIDEVRDILRARFGQRGVRNRFLGTARDLSYIYTMGGINSAITQIEDLSVSMYKAGVWNTLTTMFSGKEITRKDIGVENVSQEFVSQKKTSKWLNGLFKATGLDAIDGFGKETLINSIIKKYKQIYEKNPQALRDYLEPIMEDQTSSVINDILNDNKSDNLMYLVFSELSDVQPVSLSELPEFYNTAGNLRVLYMLKSFMVKRIDTFRNECFDKLKSKDTSVRIEGLQNLFRLSVLMIICGATKDWIIDLLYGRKTDMSETLVNNVLGMFGISKFHLYKAREQGFSGVLKEFVVPPLFSFWDDIIGDVFDVKEGKRKLKDLEVLKGIPLFGRFYYWWIGSGAEKQKKKRGKSRRR